MATIRDIARISGYSIGTVSRVINHHPDVSEKARAVIEKVIADENFQPNMNAKQLKAATESAVAVIVKGIENSFLNDLLVKVEEHLNRSGEEVNVVFLSEEENEVLAAARMENESHPKGFVFLGGSRSNFRTSFHRVHTPSVLVSTWAGDLDLDLLSSFATDDLEGSKAAVRTLLERGRKNIGCIGGYMSIDENGTIASVRLKGAVAAMAEAGIEFSPGKMYVESYFTMKDSHKAASDLMKRYPEMNALFAHSDIMALGAMRAIHDAGLRIPEDIAVIGYDGITIGEYTVPRLSTVRQDTDTMAEKAVSDLLFRMSYSRKPVHETVPFMIMERESTSV